MTGSADELRRRARLLILRSVVRAMGSTVALVVVYYLLPLDHAATWVAALILVVGLLALIAVVAYQVRKIISSPTPGLLAVEALAVSVPLFLLLFASTYVVISKISADNFGQTLTHTTSLYFAVTVFATVGFGDITAKTDAARLLVTGQMIADLVIIGVAAKVIVGAARQRRSQQPPTVNIPDRSD